MKLRFFSRGRGLRIDIEGCLARGLLLGTLRISSHKQQRDKGPTVRGDNFDNPRFEVFFLRFWAVSLELHHDCYRFLWQTP